MLRQAECQRYRQWKKQQEEAQTKGQKSKIKKKKRTEVTDCIEEEKKKKPRTVVKITFRKCEKKDKKKSKQAQSFKLKPVSSLDLLFRRIQPPLDVRHDLLVGRHADCYIEAVPRVEVMAIREAAVLKTTLKPAEKTTKKKRKKGKRKKKGKEEPTTSEAGKAKKPETEEIKEEDVTKEEDDDKDEVEEPAENAEVEEEETVQEEEEDVPKDVEEKKDEVKPRQKDKFWCKKYKRKIEEESEPECDSICSLDSDICLKGLALTVEDKKKIEENRRHVEDSKTN